MFIFIAVILFVDQNCSKVNVEDGTFWIRNNSYQLQVDFYIAQAYKSGKHGRYFWHWQRSIHGQEFTCPVDENSVCLDGFYGDPDDCTLYHECVDCQATTRQCQSGFHFDDDAKICRSPYLAGCDPDNYIRNGSAFCVTRGNGRVDGPMNPLIFSESYVNYKYPYDPLIGHWRAAHSGVYFYHMSAGTYPGRKVNMTLAGTPYPFSVVRDSEMHQFDVLSRDVLMTLNMYAVVSATLEGDTSVSSDAGKQTMWAGFNVDEFMTSVVAFFAVSNAVQFGPRTIVFEDEHFDHGAGYDPATGLYTAPASGTYFFTYSSGATANAEHRARFVGGGDASTVTEFWRGSGQNTGTDTLSKSLVYSLNAGETMSIELVSGEASNNQSTLLSFGGFLYSPKPPTPHQAWLVNSVTTQYGPVDPLIFDNEVVDTGNLFDLATNTVTMDTSGYYYISVYTGIMSGSPVSLQVIQETGTEDPVVLAEVRRSEGYNTNEDTSGRGLLVHLKAGDRLWLRLGQDSVSFSDVNKQTTFSGFLLFAIEDPEL